MTSGINFIDSIIISLVSMMVVFAVLMIIMAAISILGRIKTVDSKNNNSLTKSSQKNVLEDEDELLAVISAAIAYTTKNESKNYKIKSFKKLR